MPNDKSDKSGGVFKTHVSRLTPEEQHYQDVMQAAIERVLATVNHLSDLHKLVALKSAVAIVIKTEITQGHRGAAFKLFVQQLQDTLSQKRGTSIAGLLAPGKIGGGLKQ